MNLMNLALMSNSKKNRPKMPKTKIVQENTYMRLSMAMG